MNDHNFDPTFYIATLLDPNQSNFVDSVSDVSMQNADVDDVQEIKGTLIVRQPIPKSNKYPADGLDAHQREVEKYFEFIDSQEKCHRNPLIFWEESPQFSNLRNLAFDFLGIPASTASVERAFSIAGLSTCGRRGGNIERKPSSK